MENKKQLKKARKRPWLVKFAAVTYGVYLKKRYKLKLKNKELLDKVPGACIIMANHCHIIDPCFISTLIPFHIRWVSGAYLFKLKFVSFVLSKGATCISKQQGRSDLSTIMNVKKALKSGNCVGIFPEGNRTWDGDFLPLKLNTTAKMVRMFKVPVIFLNLEGAYAKKPRWASYPRKGGITVNISSILFPEDYKDLTIEKLHKTINSRLNFSHDTWEEENKIEFPSKNNVSGLQRILYLCPKCGSIDSLETTGKKAVCKNCKIETSMDNFLRLKSLDHNFTKVSEWRKWEIQQLKKIESFPTERGILFQILEKRKLKTLSKDFKISLKDSAINIFYKDKEFILDFEKMNSLILNSKQTIELYHNNTQYRIRLLPDGCSLKYFDFFTNFQANKKEKH